MSLSFHRYVLLAQHMPKSVKIKSSKRNPEMGVTSLDFSCVDEETFYIGSESGGMFRCSVNSQVSAGSFIRYDVILHNSAYDFYIVLGIFS